MRLGGPALRVMADPSRAWSPQTGRPKASRYLVTPDADSHGYAGEANGPQPRGAGAPIAFDF